jgi:hypothetical protein
MKDLEIIRNSAPVRKCSSDPQKSSLVDYNYQTLQTSAGHYSSTSKDNSKDPEFMQAYIRSQIPPSSVENAPDLTAKQLEEGRLSKFSTEMLAPGGCDISKQGDLSDDKVVFFWHQLIIDVWQARSRKSWQWALNQMVCRGKCFGNYVCHVCIDVVVLFPKHSKAKDTCKGLEDGEGKYRLKIGAYSSSNYMFFRYMTVLWLSFSLL